MSEEQQAKPRSSNAAMVGLIVLVVIVVAAALAYFAWQTIQPPPTLIGEILADLRTYDGMGVTVRGEVSNPINLIYKSFDLTDDSGSIKVVTERGLPKAGETVTIDGVVSEFFSIGEFNLTVIMEPAED